MKLSSNSDYFLIKEVTDGGNDYIHERMLIACGVCEGVWGEPTQRQ